MTDNPKTGDENSGLTASDFQSKMLKLAAGENPELDGSVIYLSQAVSPESRTAKISGQVNRELGAVVKEMPEVIKARKFFDDAFEETFSGLVPLVERDPDSIYRKIKEIYDFKLNKVKWVMLDGNEYRDLDDHADKGRMAIIPPGHQYGKAARSLYTISPDGQNILLVRPATMTRLWGGISLIDGIYHVLIKDLNVAGRSKFLAAQKEAGERVVSAMQYCSGGKFEGAVAGFLKSRHIKSPAVLLDFLKDLDKCKKAIKYFDAVMKTGKSLSDTEDRARWSAYELAMLFSSARDWAIRNGGTDIEAAKIEVLEKFLLQKKQGGRIPVF